MSIYPVKISDWYDVEEGAFGEHVKHLKRILLYQTCLRCKKKIEWDKGWVHHSITWGYGDAWCSEECLKGKTQMEQKLVENIWAKYTLSDAQKKRLEEWHYHAPNPHTHQKERYDHLNALTKLVAETMMQYCPDGRQLSLALTNLEQARMWANNAIAVGER